MLHRPLVSRDFWNLRFLSTQCDVPKRLHTDKNVIPSYREYDVDNKFCIINISSMGTPFTFRNKVAIFDLNLTLIDDSYKWLFRSVPRILQELYNKQNFCIVVITNESTTYKNDVINKLLTLNLPILVAMAYESSLRKPDTRIFNHIFGDMNMDFSKSFYCGDQMGRPGDISDSDLVYGRAIGLRTFCPEEIFK